MVTVLVILISIVAYHLVRNRFCRELILSVTSLFVYFTFVDLYALLAPLMAGVTYIAVVMEQHYSKYIKTIRSVYCLMLFIGLLFLKYGSDSWMLPVGYSIMAFSGISVVVDMKKHSQSYSFIEILNYLAFFPKLLAGPLERIGAFNEQMQTRWEKQSRYIGLKYIVFGLFGKYIVADGIGMSLTFDSCGVNVFVEAICFAIQFYLDFWSYCNIAMGISLLYGIKLTRNFCNPYSARSFKDFWTRWNITLTSWLRDYVYIPLGGNQVSQWRWFANIFIVFLISGLWHGLTIAFITWGFLHAGFYCIEKLCFKGVGDRLYQGFVLIVAMFLWQLFRLSSVDEIATYVAQLFSWQDIQLPLVITALISAILLCIFETRLFQRLVFEYPSNRREVILEVVSISIMGLITLLGNYNSDSPFFYFSF